MHKRTICTVRKNHLYRNFWKSITICSASWIWSSWRDRRYYKFSSAFQKDICFFKIKTIAHVPTRGCCGLTNSTAAAHITTLLEMQLSAVTHQLQGFWHWSEAGETLLSFQIYARQQSAIFNKYITQQCLVAEAFLFSSSKNRRDFSRVVLGVVGDQWPPQGRQ